MPKASQWETRLQRPFLTCRRHLKEEPGTAGLPNPVISNPSSSSGTDQSKTSQSQLQRVVHHHNCQSDTPLTGNNWRNQNQMLQTRGATSLRRKSELQTLKSTFMRNLAGIYNKYTTSKVLGIRCHGKSGKLLYTLLPPTHPHPRHSPLQVHDLTKSYFPHHLHSHNSAE